MALSVPRDEVHVAALGCDDDTVAGQAHAFGFSGRHFDRLHGGGSTGDVAADNASSGAFVTGPVGLPPAELDLALEGVLVETNGVVVDSSEVGLRKPDPAIFHLACSRLGVTPDQAVFLDDSPGHVRAAEALGLHGVLFANPIDGLAALDRILEEARAA